MTAADVAVVVPVYNRAGTVLETLASVSAQTTTPRRLIVVDDGSRDATAKSVEEYFAAHPASYQTLLLRQPNRGASAARNAGLRASTDCRYIAFLDSDDLWPADFLARCTAALQGNSAAVAVSCDRLTIDVDEHESRLDDLQPLSDDATKWLFCHDGGIGSTTLFRTAAIRRLGGYNERLPTGHDSALFFRLSLEGAWLHAPGLPTQFRRGQPRRPGEQPNLSGTMPDSQRRWARIFEEFILEQGGERVLDARVYQAVLSQRWKNAARQLMRAGRTTEARDCLQRSLQWQFWKPKLWFQLAQTYLRRAA